MVMAKSELEQNIESSKVEEIGIKSRRAELCSMLHCGYFINDTSWLDEAQDIYRSVLLGEDFGSNPNG